MTKLARMVRLRRLDSAAAGRLARWLVPILMGLLSLRLGQDDNWDLKNYHLYNPFAFLNGKIGFDLAPAQWQSYFNPTLDLLYYGLTLALPGPLAGFIMGALHGLNFILLLGIAYQVLAPAESRRIPLLLTLAGMLGTAFLAQLGNSMGDNMTSLFVLGSLLLVLASWQAMTDGSRAGMLRATVAGLVMGLGCGLKLTNATYALALCAALLVLPGSATLRVRTAFLFGVGVLAGIAISAGHWFVLMHQTFGNPLFPQFNDVFHSPLAAPVGIGDTGWLPKNVGEKLLWPFVFAGDARRVGELPLRLWVWPFVYVGMVAVALRAAFFRKVPQAPAHVLRQRLLMVFFSTAYLAWMNLFSIYRYLVPIELLAPLVIWLLAFRLLPQDRAGKAATVLIALSALSGLPRASWGHAPWSRSAFSATVPSFPAPRESMVFTVHGDPPMGWLVTRFPLDLAFVALGSGFPESPAFIEKVHHMAKMRQGPFYVMLQADRAAPGAQRSVAAVEQAQALDAQTLRKAAEVLGRYDMRVDSASCQAYPAFIGKSHWNYQLCRVSLSDFTSAPPRHGSRALP